MWGIKELSSSPCNYRLMSFTTKLIQLHGGLRGALGAARVGLGVKCPALPDVRRRSAIDCLLPLNWNVASESWLGGSPQAIFGSDYIKEVWNIVGILMDFMLVSFPSQWQEPYAPIYSCR